MESSTFDADKSATTPNSEAPSRAVVSAIAEADGVDETELPPLFHAVDPDALDALFRPGRREATESRGSGTVTFGYHGYEVSVSADGTVQVEEKTTP